MDEDLNEALRTIRSLSRQIAEMRLKIQSAIDYLELLRHDSESTGHEKVAAEVILDYLNQSHNLLQWSGSEGKPQAD